MRTEHPRHPEAGYHDTAGPSDRQQWCKSEKLSSEQIRTLGKLSTDMPELAHVEDILKPFNRPNLACTDHHHSRNNQHTVNTDLNLSALQCLKPDSRHQRCRRSSTMSVNSSWCDCERAGSLWARSLRRQQQLRGDVERPVGRPAGARRQHHRHAAEHPQLRRQRKRRQARLVAGCRRHPAPRRGCTAS